MPMDALSEDMSNGGFEAKKVPGSKSFNVYSRRNGAQDGILFALEDQWYVSVMDGSDPLGPFTSAEDAFKDTWGSF